VENQIYALPANSLLFFMTFVKCESPAKGVINNHH